MGLPRCARRQSDGAGRGRSSPSLGGTGRGRPRFMRPLSACCPPIKAPVTLAMAEGDYSPCPPMRGPAWALATYPQGPHDFSQPHRAGESRQVGADLNTGETARRLLEEVLGRISHAAGAGSAERRDTCPGGSNRCSPLPGRWWAIPRLLLLDEPSEGIQPNIVQEMAAKLAAINQRHHLSIIVVEQNIALAAALAHRVYVMEKGSDCRGNSSE